LVNNVMLFTEQNLNSLQLKGKHQMGVLDLDWTGSFSFSGTEQPDFRVLSYEAEVIEPNVFTQDTFCFDPECNDFIVNDVFDTTLLDTSDRRFVAASTDVESGRFFRKLRQRTFDIRVNANYTVPLWLGIKEKEWKIKFGGAYTFKDRNFYENLLNSGLVGATNPSLSFTDTTGGLFGSSVNSLIDTYPNLAFIWLNTAGVPYLAKQTIIAGYAMTEFSPSKYLNVIAGLRYEYTDMLINGFPIGETLTEADGAFVQNDFLPALHFIIKPARKANIRLGYSRTLARPSFRETSLFVNGNFNGDLRTAGSPFLRRSIVDNIDLRLEWSPGIGEILSVGGFYKEILGPIELIGTPAFLEYNNLRVGSDTEPINPIIPKQVEDDLTGKPSVSQGTFGPLSVALAYGYEIEIRKNFGFLGDGWEKLVLWGNYALLRTEVPLDERAQNSTTQVFRDRIDEVFPNGIPQSRRLYGQPTQTLNSSLAYSDRDGSGWEFSLGFNYFGDRIVVVLDNAVNIVEKGRGLLNASVTKTLKNGISIRFRARNLLDPQYRQVYQILDTDQELEVFENYTRGRSYSLGVSFDLKR